MLAAMSSHKPLPLNLSSSWYWTPVDPKSDNPFFQKLAAQGQSFFQAAGDSGAWWHLERCGRWNLHYVICVGGTDFVTKGAGKGPGHRKPFGSMAAAGFLPTTWRLRAGSYLKG